MSRCRHPGSSLVMLLICGFCRLIRSQWGLIGSHLLLFISIVGPLLSPLSPFPVPAAPTPFAAFLQILGSNCKSNLSRCCVQVERRPAARASSLSRFLSTSHICIDLFELEGRRYREVDPYWFALRVRLSFIWWKATAPIEIGQRREQQGDHVRLSARLTWERRDVQFRKGTVQPP